jgi:hypothetical protein
MDDDDLRYRSGVVVSTSLNLLVIRVEDIEDLPDDLTPFITRTTPDPTSGGAYGDVWKCDYNADGISTPVSPSLDSLTILLGYTTD